MTGGSGPQGSTAQVSTVRTGSVAVGKSMGRARVIFFPLPCFQLLHFYCVLPNNNRYFLLQISIQRNDTKAGFAVHRSCIL